MLPSVAELPRTDRIVKYPSKRRACRYTIDTWHDSSCRRNMALKQMVGFSCGGMRGHAVAYWLRHYALIPSLTDMSTRDRNNKCFWGVERGRCVNLTNSAPSVSRLSRWCGILNISQAYSPPQAIMGTVSFYFEIFMRGDCVRILK
jgi:hypothetical protein